MNCAQPPGFRAEKRDRPTPLWSRAVPSVLRVRSTYRAAPASEPVVAAES